MKLEDALKNLEGSLDCVKYSGTLQEVQSLSQALQESLATVKEALVPKEVVALDATKAE